MARALVGLCLVIPACGFPDLPDRRSPKLVPTEPAFIAASAGGTDTADDDPAWWELAANAEGWEIWTRQGRLTDLLDQPPGFGPGAIRAFDDGTALTCGGNGIARWENGSWTKYPYPSLPDLVGEDNPLCFGFAAADPTEAWFVLGTGYLCRFDGQFDCADVSQTITSDPIYGPRIINDVAMTSASVFIIHPQSSNDSTELYVVDRGAPAQSVRRIGTVNGQGHRLYAVPGVEQAVVELEDDIDVRSPVVINRDGIDRVIDLRRLGNSGDSNLEIRANVVTLPDGIYVVANRFYSSVECEDGDDPDCTSTLHWSEMVVLRDRDGDVVEVGHLGVEGDVIAGTGFRVDGALRIETLDSWYRLAE